MKDRRDRVAIHPPAPLSVVAAEAIGAWLREQGHEVEVIHLTMDLALALKTGSYLEEEKK